MSDSQLRNSREYRWSEIVTSQDISGVTVDVAYTASANDFPETVDWEEATLVAPGDPMGDGKWWIRILVGPGGEVELGPGDYQEWTRITDSPEIIVRRPGMVTIH